MEKILAIIGGSCIRETRGSDLDIDTFFYLAQLLVIIPIILSFFIYSQDDLAYCDERQL